MATSDDYLKLYMESLAAEGCERGPLGDKEAELIEWQGRLRKKRDQHIREMETARLLPLGADVLMARFGGCRATQYNRAKRGRMLSKSREAS